MTKHVSITISKELGKQELCNNSVIDSQSSIRVNLKAPPAAEQAILSQAQLNPAAPAFFPRRRPFIATHTRLPAEAITTLHRPRPVNAKPSISLRSRTVIAKPSSIHRSRTVNATRPINGAPLEQSQPETEAIRPRDELDELVDQAVKALREAPDWETFFEQQKDPRGDWGPVESIQHPASHLLTRYKRRGVPVLMQTKDWTKGQRQAALARGPHKSAKDHIAFLRQEYCDMIKKGHWLLLPADLVLDLDELRLSPLGVVPQRERRPRTISDYSYWGINAETVKLAPQEAMQFGKALPRLLRLILESDPRFGPVHMAKIDIADGFYRLGLEARQALRLGVLFPTRPGDRPLIGIPLVLPMGWSESPPAFCAATETAADLANNMLSNEWQALDASHRLDAVSETPGDQSPYLGQGAGPQRRSDIRYRSRPTKHWDVYVDDFLGLVQGNRKTRQKVKRALLVSLDKIFRPLDAQDSPMRQEPASIKKLRKGDGTWSTRKTMLGWDIDTVKQTLELPPHRKERLHAILDSIKPGQHTVLTEDWHKLLGELRSMSIAIPGSRGLFSLLQEAFRHEEKHRKRLRLTKAVHEVLDDFRWLAQDVANRPTRIAELVPGTPSVLGACDAAGEGMGGVFFVPDEEGEITPHLWRAKFPMNTQRELVSFDNPGGTINNSDLELCGNLAHQDVIARNVDVAERTIHTLSDNVASVYWLRKGATTTTDQAMAQMRTVDANDFLADLGLAQEAVRKGVSPDYAKRKDAHWVIWLQFCAQLKLDPFLSNIQDPIPILQVFAQRYRDGRLAPSQRTVTSKYVSDVVCSIGQAFMRMGAPDPRLSHIDGKIDFRLRRQYRSWSKADPPPARVKPVPVPMVLHLVNLAYNRIAGPASPNPAPSRAIADMVCIAYYFLLRPTEYSGTDKKYSVFTLKDVSLHIGARKLDLDHASDRELDAATSMRLHFTTQKNQHKGDNIAHARSSHPFCCPVLAAVRMIKVHRNWFVSKGLPFDDTVRLASYYHRDKRINITAQDITKHLRSAARHCFMQTGIDPKDITARSLRAGGAMALLCSRVDKNTIQLLGRWHSDAMMDYLRQEAEPIMANLAKKMFHDGDYSFSHNAVVPLL